MSSTDTPRPAGRRLHAGAVCALAAAALALTLSGCAADDDHPSTAGSASASSAVPADELTRRLAVVEAARQCAVTTTSFPDEAALTTDLDDRLAADGLTHQQWKDWHDALAHSPDLVSQLVEASAPGCAGA